MQKEPQRLEQRDIIVSFKTTFGKAHAKTQLNGARRQGMLK